MAVKREGPSMPKDYEKLFKKQPDDPMNMEAPEEPEEAPPPPPQPQFPMELSPTDQAIHDTVVPTSEEEILVVDESTVAQDIAHPEAIVFPSAAVEAPPPVSTDSRFERLLAVMERMYVPPDRAPMPAVTSSPEDAARMLISIMPEEFQMKLMQVAADKAQGSLAAAILGHLRAADDRDDLGEVAIDPEWYQSLLPTAPTAPFVGPRASGQNVPGVCEQCALPFRGRYGQRYCCTPCGKVGSGYHDGGPAHAQDCSTTGMLQTRLHQAAAQAQALQKAS